MDRGSAGGPLLLGWSSQCLQGWGPFFRLAVPSMLMTCIEWWAYEIGSFLMGTWTAGCGEPRGPPPSSGPPLPDGRSPSPARLPTGP